ncbi:methionine aminopeptidase [Cardiosporidium cionae]|uniref:Methionine aminopeptidase n=1 Tax=Cardiosporidium cionae TaxID=476202 RepID=A0ABQ7JCS1_9APIC|nr:methionine aminopeptidase [Cardiosporidium cionae]|eukprot:KAF8821812.1 methionine aminopeptidase [Cardiosporidium cionae]
MRFANRGFGAYSDHESFLSTARSTQKKALQGTDPLYSDSAKEWTGFKYTGSLKKGRVSPLKRITDGILRPPYVSLGPAYLRIKEKKDALVQSTPAAISIKSKEEIENMREAGRLARKILDAVSQSIKVGVSTDMLDKLAHEQCMRLNIYPSPLLYKGFPKSICTSINEVLCHGIPDSTVLQDGDIINIDITCYYKGVHADCSETYLVGNVDEKGKRLVKTTFDAWMNALQLCKPGEKFLKIGECIEAYVTSRGYTSLDGFCGHGIGRNFHEEPHIFHVKNTYEGKMLPGMAFTIEPVICEGSAGVHAWPDGWTITTKDGKRSAQFEHTILITLDGYEILTSKFSESPSYFWENT